MASSEFVRLFRDTPGAISGADRVSSQGPFHKSMKANDLELIFARKKRRGDKYISFETFLEFYSVMNKSHLSNCA